MRRTVPISLVFAVAIVTAACGAGGGEPPACSNFSTSTTVSMDDFSYGPNCLREPAGTTLSIENAGAAPHTFSLEGTEASVDVPAGEQATLDLSGVAEGTYTVICTYHPQMKATIEVG